MEYQLAAGAGLLLSITLFYFSYRHTVGARCERIAQANAAVETVLLRRFILEQFDASSAEITWLIQSKANACKVPASALHSESQFLTNLIGRVMEWDHLPRSQRREVISRLAAALQHTELRRFTARDIDDVHGSRQQRFILRLTPLLLALLAAAVGAAVAAMPLLLTAELSRAPLGVVAVVATASLFAIGALQLFQKIREVHEQTTLSSRSAALQEQLQFEDEVVELIENCGGRLRPATVNGEGYDFQMATGHKNLLLAVKPVKQSPPASLIGRQLQMLSVAVQQSQADEGLLITKGHIELPAIRPVGKPVRVLSINEFRHLLLDSSEAFVASLPASQIAPAQKHSQDGDGERPPPRRAAESRGVTQQQPEPTAISANRDYPSTHNIRR